MKRIINKLIKHIKINQKPEEIDAIPPKAMPIEVGNPDHPERIYGRDFYPLRKLFLWGWDQEDNPGFLVLYGLHQFRGNENGKNELDEQVLYTDYAIFRGSEGHFPSFEAIKVLNERDYPSRVSTKRMYYKRDIEGHGYWHRADKTKAIKDFVTLKESDAISLPYFEGLSHEDYVTRITGKRLKFENFRLAKTPVDVLQLDNGLAAYSDNLYEILGNPNLYMRKKYLKELIRLNPPRELYDLLLQVGSSELISGLFLELCLQKNDMLLAAAKKFLDSDIRFTGESYANGIKRCASLYVDSFDIEMTENKIRFIKENLPDMDLHIQCVNGKEVQQDRVIEGVAYRKYAYQGYLSEYFGYYSREQNKYVKERRKNLYKESYYSDGVTLHLNHVKNTIQEAQVYGLADIIGTIAYYFDAPRLTYYFKGNGNYKGLQYFRRYLRRIINTYAKNDEARFMDAMKVLLTNYKNEDYLCKFKGNFQFNYFIKHYLYYDFNEEAPRDWHGRWQWFRDDQLMKLEGRYEFLHELWDRHLEDVIDIAAEAKIPIVLKSMYYILKDTNNQERIRNDMPYDRLFLAIASPYEPISEMFLEIIREKLEKETRFDIDILIRILHCPDKRIQEIWTELFRQNLEGLDENKYLIFLHAMMNQMDAFTEHPVIWPEDLKEVLDASLNKLGLITTREKTDLIACLIAKLGSHQEIPECILEFMEKIVFSNTYDELNGMLEKLDTDLEQSLIVPKSMLMTGVLKAIRQNQLPADGQILEILESGTSKMLKVFLQMLMVHKEQLHTRYSTLLIMLESDIVALHELAKPVFEQLPKEEQKKLHSMMLDSPDKEVHSYGLQKLYELYEKPDALIPEEFILQMLEHPSAEVKAFISNKLMEIINHLGNGNQELFLYYSRTLLFLPNKASVSKQRIYEVLPIFAWQYQNRRAEVEQLLLDVGGSNVIADSERALVALARIRKEVVSN